MHSVFLCVQLVILHYFLKNTRDYTTKFYKLYVLPFQVRGQLREQAVSLRESKRKKGSGKDPALASEASNQPDHCIYLAF